MTRPFSCNRLTELFFVSLLLVWTGLGVLSAGCRAHDEDASVQTVSIPVRLHIVRDRHASVIPTQHKNPE